MTKPDITEQLDAELRATIANAVASTFPELDAAAQEAKTDEIVSEFDQITADFLARAVKAHPPVEMDR